MKFGKEHFIEDNPLYDEKKNLEETYEPYLTKDVIPSFWVQPDMVEEYSEIAQSINDYFNEQQALFISGEQDVDDDSVWETYCSGLEAMGLSTYLEVRGVTEILE